jgi:hypothetical protein
MKNEPTQQQRSRDHQPEAEVVHARKGHVGRADLQRHHPVCEAHEGRHDGAKHHDQAVHGGELVEQLGVHELQTGLEQLGTDQQRQHPAHHQHGEREQQVQRADVLVVGGINPAAPACGSVVMVIVRAVRGACSVCGMVKNCAHGWDSSVHSGTVHLPRWATTSAGCTSWPVLLDQAFLV